VRAIDAVRASGVRLEYALVDLASGKPFDQASYLNIEPAAGSIEIGGIVLDPRWRSRPLSSVGSRQRILTPRAVSECAYRS
jgi:hypothetical protein